MLWLYFVRGKGSMAWIRIGVVLYIFSPVVVIPQLVVDDSLVPRAGADDVNLILRYFNISKKGMLPQILISKVTYNLVQIIIATVVCLSTWKRLEVLEEILSHTLRFSF